MSFSASSAAGGFLEIVDRERSPLRALAPDYAELMRQIHSADYTPWHA
jgi:hypothetical protein